MAVTSTIDATSAAALRADFLTLLVTQLQNQDPLEPVNQDNFISQLAQFSTVQGIEQLNDQFSNVLYMQQVLNGFDLVDKTVSYFPAGSTTPEQGQVSQVFIEGGNINAVINGNIIPIRDVTGVYGADGAVA